MEPIHLKLLKDIKLFNLMVNKENNHYVSYFDEIVQFISTTLSPHEL